MRFGISPLKLTSSEGYFTVALLLFIASFIVLPSAKQVNNAYYLGLFAPALVYLALHPARVVPKTPEMWLCLVFFVLAGLSGAFHGGDYAFFKHLAYSLTFVLIVSNLADPGTFFLPVFKRTCFWLVGAYIILSSMVYWVTGTYAPGERILWLPGRMDGPIYTSMWLVSSFALASSVWIRERRHVELVAALTLSVFCVAYLLQSRSGLVGLVSLPLFLLVANTRPVNRRRLVLVVLLLTAAVMTGWYSGLLSPLFARGDAFRFTIWRLFFSDWQQCGVIQGCGLIHREVFFTLDGANLKAHPHNIYLAIGVRLGLLPLLAFVATQVLSLRRARCLGNSWGLYLSVALVMLSFDGDLVVGNPDELWLLVWLPMALIARAAEFRETSHAP